jgi:hypothetical protein
MYALCKQLQTKVKPRATQTREPFGRCPECEACCPDKAPWLAICTHTHTHTHTQVNTSSSCSPAITIHHMSGMCILICCWAEAILVHTLQEAVQPQVPPGAPRDPDRM